MCCLPYFGVVIHLSSVSDDCPCYTTTGTRLKGSCFYLGFYDRFKNITVVDTLPWIEEFRLDTTEDISFPAPSVSTTTNLSIFSIEVVNFISNSTLNVANYYPNLRELTVLADNLVGELPTSIGLLSNLRSLFFASNNGTKFPTIPTEIGMLNNLYWLQFISKLNYFF